MDSANELNELKTDFFPGPPNKIFDSQYLDIVLLKLRTSQVIPNFWLSEPWDDNFFVFWATKFVVIC